ncbi:MAG: formylglycine-generating enzyme family protein, partial [Treponema sp.]|nr:formylglycine-generating enzyme family protein [Treponema sp.]
IPGRVFASLFFPRRLVLEAGLTSDNPDGVLLAGAKDYAAWTFGGEPTATWQIPFSLSEGAYRAGVSGTDQFTQDMLAASSRFAVTRAAVRDLLRAKLLSDAKGLSPSPLGLLYSGADILRFLSQTPGAPQWLGDVLSAEQIAGLKDSTWYTKASEKLARADSVISEKNTEHGKPPISRLNLGGMIYDGVNSGMLVRGFPYQAQYLPAFMLCTTEVTKEAFNTFIRENPQWNSDNAENLTAQSLASDDYLIDDKPDTLQSAGICGVSWHAARAYCQWLSARLPPSMAAYEVRLPFEAEWEYALGLNSSGHTTENAAAPSGTLWEWCADPWTPVDYIPAPDNAIAALGSPERSLRGILNPADPESYKTRASLPPEFCSSFVSFRPVIALKSDVWQKE